MSTDESTSASSIVAATTSLSGAQLSVADCCCAISALILYGPMHSYRHLEFALRSWLRPHQTAACEWAALGFRE